MIVSQCHIHHRTYLDSLIRPFTDRNGPTLDRVHPQHRRLWRVDDRGGHQRPEHPAVGDGKRPALQVFDGKLVGLDLLGEIGDRFFDLGETHALGVAKNRHHQPLTRADRDTDVVVILVNDVRAPDLSVDSGELHQRVDHRPGEKRHEPELDVVLLKKRVLVLVAQFHDRGHVDLVEGRQQRGGLLGLDESFGDALSHRGHGDDLLPSPRHGIGSRLRRSGRLIRRPLFHVGLHIFFQDTSAGPGRRDLRGIESVLLDESLRRRHDAGRAVAVLQGR